MFSKFLRKSRRLYENVGKYNTGRQATDDNIIRCKKEDAIYMPDNEGKNTHTHNI
jgi:hypothetical protein